MVNYQEDAKEIAKFLLQIKAIILQPDNPFTWASGWKSPIYCDNRKTLSFPSIRTHIRIKLCEIIKEQYPHVNVIAGVATGGIAIGALVAEELGLPFIYVRASNKNHGKKNLIEGYESIRKISEKEKKLLEAQRLEQRTNHDLAMIQAAGTCPGIEN